MKHFEVCFNVGDGIYSVNTIWANTGNEELEAATETAQRRAQRYGYELAYIKPISEIEADEACCRGRHMYPIDEEAERAHDPSFAEDKRQQAVNDLVTALDAIQSAYGNPDLLGIDDKLGSELTGVYDRMMAVYAELDPVGCLDYAMA